MKRLLLTAALMLGMTTNAQAFTDSTEFADCHPLEDMAVALRGAGFRIQMVLDNTHIPNAGGQTLLLANTETTQWAMIAISPQFGNLACVIQEGVGFGEGSLQFIPTSGDPT